MPKQSKTRIVVNLNGNVKEILSILEKKDGDLIIFPKPEENYDGSLRSGPIKNEHVSIHQSANSNGFLIKTTTLLEEGQIITNAQFRQPGPDGLAALIYGHATADLSNSRYDCKCKKEDNLVYLYKDDIAGSGILFYFLIASASSGDFPLNAKTEPTILHFKNFTILCLSGFLPLLPFRKSVKFRYVTSAPRTGQANDPAPLKMDLTALPLQTCVNLAESNIEPLARLLYNEHLAEDLKRPEKQKLYYLIKQLEPYLDKFNRYPKSHIENVGPPKAP